MAVDNEAVRKIICEKLGFSTGDSLGARIGEAFDMVTLEREGRGKGDVNYATAEHYMFARYVICWTGYAGLPFMVGGISAYLGLKLLFPNLSRLAKNGKRPSHSGLDRRS